ncbi:N-acetylmuramoyl-L-alanine amidase [Candidatus Dojkabacteria bacterium]|uniref:N-acetylmuramoyl-L-alanine amidase n=1 Tax=Candidatus Dojkabacteria bacterium TaxID=2099670 RepID=A0A955L2J5_9BACT|nr:N-acetylmuramoyl-L-alanine amidase [Candidatus Dojkabacteria bacterium]
MSKKYIKYFSICTLTFCVGLASIHSVEARGADITEINPIRSVVNTVNYPIISRSEWGCPDMDPESPYYCNEPQWYAFRNPVSHIVIHHTATSETPTDGKEEIQYVWTLHATVRDVDPNDNVQGWTDIGYNYLVDQEGNVYEGRYGGEGATGGHVGGHNIGTVGIALLGNYETLEVTDPEYQALKGLLIELFTKYKIDPEEFATDYTGGYAQRLSMHQNWNSTACPGGHTVEIFNQLRSEVAKQVRENWNDMFESSMCPKGYIDNNGECEELVATPEFSSQLIKPSEIISDSSDNLFVTGYDSTYLYQIDSNSNISQLSESFFLRDAIKGAVDIEIDDKNDLIYILNNTKERLYVIDKNTLESVDSYLTGTSPKDMEIMNDGTIYVANAGSDTLTKIDPEGNLSAVKLEGEYPISLTKNENDDLFVTFYLSDAITKITKKGKMEDYTTAGILPTSVIPDSTGGFYILNEGDGKIIYVDDREVLHTYAELPYQGNSFIRTEDGSFFVTHPLDSAISKVDPKGYVTTIENVGNEPVKLFQYDGDIYFLDQGNNGIYKLTYSAQNSIPMTMPIYRFWSDKQHSHFFTGDIDEKNYVKDEYDEATWNYETVAFFGLEDSKNNAKPVYRFWSDEYQAHFYTIDGAEKEYVIDAFDDSVWKYEGIAYYAYTNEEEGTTPVYRFWSDEYHSHFYTTDEAEKDYVINTFDESTWKYEGEAYFAYPSN